jgi:outer membrane immunogenic protein
MKNTILAALACTALIGTALIGTASAADLSRRAAPVAAPIYAPPAYYNWTGFYAGINAGYGWGTGSLAEIDVGPSGGLIGGTLGYNWQVGQIVWGLETDLQWSSIEASGPCRGNRSCEVNSDWFGTARGRMGFAAWDRWMPYITAGIAYGNIGANVSGIGGRSETNAGWTLGAGVEYAMWTGWTAKFEYLFVDLGDFDCGVRDCGGRPRGGLANQVDYQASILRVGANYRF